LALPTATNFVLTAATNFVLTAAANFVVPTAILMMPAEPVRAARSRRVARPAARVSTSSPLGSWVPRIVHAVGVQAPLKGSTH
jgi:hypothetical protein